MSVDQLRKLINLIENDEMFADPRPYMRLIDTEVTASDDEQEQVVENYECKFKVRCAGDSMWGETQGRIVNVTGISIVKTEYFEDNYMQVSVNVEHDSGWDIYTDSGFEDAISRAVGFPVSFTEQGMQEDGLASLEAR